MSAVVVGEFFIDEILTEFQTLPKLGEESFARKFRRDAGGGAAITACGLAKLGIDVAVVGVVGKEDGEFVLKRLKSCGINCSAMETHPAEPTGLTVSVSTREDRAFFSYYGANETLKDVLARPKTIETLSKAKHVHFACAPDSERHQTLFQALRAKKRRISIDVQAHIGWLTRPESLKILQSCDIFFPNEREAEWISEESGTPAILRSLKEKGLRGVGLKLGGRGAALLWENRHFFADPVPVKTADTTGAGDCFDAGFIYAWLRGDKPQRCLEIANLCGALSTRALGGIEGFPSLRELRGAEGKLVRRT
jgi:sugar/nucleoside kinase (ribokinase family)